MIKDMVQVMQRINEIKKRFGLMRHNTSGLGIKTGAEPDKQQASFSNVMQKQMAPGDVSAVSGQIKAAPGHDYSSVKKVISPGFELLKTISGTLKNQGNGLFPAGDLSENRTEDKNGAAGDYIRRLINEYKSNQ